MKPEDGHQNRALLGVRQIEPIFQPGNKVRAHNDDAERAEIIERVWISRGFATQSADSAAARSSRRCWQIACAVSV